MLLISKYRLKAVKTVLRAAQTLDIFLLVFTASKHSLGVTSLLLYQLRYKAVLPGYESSSSITPS